MQKNALMNVELEGVKKFKKGKVRDIYQLEDMLLIIASDRISAFDVVMPNGIPDKGKILTKISCFWFDYVKDLIGNHLITSDINEIISLDGNLASYKDILKDRSMLVKKTDPVPIECVVRGYLTGSGWKEYKESGRICGIELPDGLKQSQKLPKPIFTPSTKSERGHDKNLTALRAAEIAGSEDFEYIKNKSIEIYNKAAEFAESKGVIIADTKFEFGKIGNKIILIDELLTPDSSRFWPRSDYEIGKNQKSFDKQFARDYLDSLGWDKNPPAPMLPDDITEKTYQKYLKILELITGSTL
jgi:phosphoribosylaminoimidazole-succinocarboxamide synthase